VVQEIGVQRCKFTLKSFELMKIREKYLEIWAKSVKAFVKSLKI